MNRILLSDCGQFMECWNNGSRCYTVHIGGQFADALGRAREYFRKWGGDEMPHISRQLAAMVDADFPAMAQWIDRKEKK